MERYLEQTHMLNFSVGKIQQLISRRTGKTNPPVELGVGENT